MEKFYKKEDVHFFTKYFEKKNITLLDAFRPENDYIFAGIFNKDKSKVKDIISGKLYTYDKHSNMLFDGNDLFVPFSYAHITGLSKSLTNIIPNMFYSENMTIQNKNRNSVFILINNNMVTVKNFKKYHNKPNNSIVSNNEIKSVINNLNKAINKEFTNQAKQMGINLKQINQIENEFNF